MPMFCGLAAIVKCDLEYRAGIERSKSTERVIRGILQSRGR